ncbi:unknown [Clostridium sp. CAG:448]|nr:unknown [Clostridium sp. CAG:448]
MPKRIPDADKEVARFCHRITANGHHPLGQRHTAFQRVIRRNDRSHIYHHTSDICGQLPGPDPFPGQCINQHMFAALRIPRRQEGNTNTLFTCHDIAQMRRRIAFVVLQRNHCLRIGIQTQ